MNKYFNPEVSNILGPVTGDAHALNFGDFKTDKETSFSNIDVDDFGYASVVFEAVRFFSSVAIGRPDLSLTKIIESYLAGVNGQETPTPSFLEFPKSNNFAKELDQYANTRITDNKLNYEKLEISPLPFACDANFKQEIVSALEKIMEVYSVLKLLDIGYKIKADGGSKGMLRLIILIESKGHKAIFEIKQLDTPATAYFNNQPALKDRLKLWHQSFKIQPSPLFGAIDSKHDFILRPKTKDLFKFEKLTKGNQEIFLEYVANFLGRRAAQHPSKGLILSQKENLLKATKAYVELFLHENLARN